MTLPIDDKLFENGYCVGCYVATIDKGPRIRLPRVIITALKKHKVRQLWRFPDPTGARIILCPAQNRQTYVDVVKQNLPPNIDPGEAQRRFICAGTPVTVADHGRVSITLVFNEHIKVVAGEQVVIVGAGQWYELWRQDDWSGGEINNGNS
jgi:DNA-binding transcriptional regulator/RsmH inhibitor MraZ